MVDDPPIEIGDDKLARLMGQRKEEALRLFLDKYGGKVKGYLMKRYRGILDESEVDQAVLDGALNVWCNATKFKESDGGLGGWFLVIALRAAIDIIRGERR